MARRLCEVAEGFVSDIDALAGKCKTKSEDEEFQDNMPFYAPLDVALVCAEVMFSGVASAIEKGIVKPLYYADRALFGKPGYHMNWLFR